MRIKLLEIEGWEREVFEPLHDRHEVVYPEQPLSADNASWLKDAEAFASGKPPTAAGQHP